MGRAITIQLLNKIHEASIYSLIADEQCSRQKFVSKVGGGGLLDSMWLINITGCGQCVYTRSVYCNNNDCLFDCLYTL